MKKVIFDEKKQLSPFPIISISCQWKKNSLKIVIFQLNKSISPTIFAEYKRNRAKPLIVTKQFNAYNVNLLFPYLTSDETYQFCLCPVNSSVKFLTKNTPINDVNYAGYISAWYLSHSHSFLLICYCHFLVILINHSV